MAAQRFMTSDFLKIHTNMTAVTSQCNLMEFCKGQNKWKSGGIMSDESDELPSQAVMAFAWSSNKYALLCYTDERLYIFY